MSWLQSLQSGWGAIFHCLTLLREGVCLLEGLTPREALLVGALTLGVSRGVVTRRPIRLAAPCQALTHPVDKAAKGVIGWVLAPYHASRDCRVR